MITDLDLEKLLKLSKIEIEEEKKETYKKWLEETILFVDVLKELNLEKVPPTFSVNNLVNVAREDISKSNNLINIENKDIKISQVVNK